MSPLDLDNLSRRKVPQYIDGAWFGRHAFRCGLGARPNEARVSGKDIQSVLRHADITTTQTYNLLPKYERAQARRKKLDKTLQTKYGSKG
jgi:integrase